jgi:RHS repeat-associated protein
MYKGKTTLNPTKTISSNFELPLRMNCAPCTPSVAGGRAETVYSSGAVGMAIRAGRPAYRTGRPGQCEAHRTCLPDRQVALTLLIQTSMPHIPSRTFGFCSTFVSRQKWKNPCQQAGFVGVSITAYNNWEKLEIDGGFTAPMDGFLYVYVANESASDKEVFFDDIKILHESSVATFKVSQINDYYPFGMLAGNSWRNDAYIDPACPAGRPGMLYQGAYARYDSLTGYYDFASRSYDPALGRFFAVDPAGQFSSPYVGMGNMPMLGVDEDGEFFWIGFAVGFLTTAITTPKSEGSDWFARSLMAGLASGLGAAGGKALTTSLLEVGKKAFISYAMGGAVGSTLAYTINLNNYDEKYNKHYGKGLLIAPISGFLGGGVGGSFTNQGLGAVVGGFAAGSSSAAMHGADLNRILTSGLIGSGVSYGSYQIGMAMNKAPYGSRKENIKEYKELTHKDRQLLRQAYREYKNGNNEPIEKLGYKLDKNNEYPLRLTVTKGVVKKAQIMNVGAQQKINPEYKMFNVGTGIKRIVPHYEISQTSIYIGNAMSILYPSPYITYVIYSRTNLLGN